MIPDVQRNVGSEVFAYGNLPHRLHPFTPNEKQYLVQQIVGIGTRSFGTPDYMPPEQWKGEVSIQTDVFSLGATLYELLTSRHPMSLFAGSRPRQSNPYIPEWVEGAIIRSMDLDPSRRFDSVSEIEAIFQSNLDPLKRAGINVTIQEWTMGSKSEIHNSGTISNTDGQLFIGQFNDVVANLNQAGKAEFADALGVLKEAVMASTHIPTDEKREHVEVIAKIGEEAAKARPNKTLIKAMGDGLLSILKTIPDMAKAIAAVAPLLLPTP